jgi:hypothetical protein
LLVAGPPVGSSAAIDAAGVDTDTQRANVDKTSFDILLHGLATPADVTAAASAYFQSSESFASSVASAASSIVEYQSALNRYCATRKETRGGTAVGKRIEEVGLATQSLKEKLVEVFTGSGDFSSAASLHSRTAQRVVASATEAAVAINNVGTMVKCKDMGKRRKYSILQALKKAQSQTALSDKQAGYSLSARDIICEVHNAQKSWEDCVSLLEDALNSGTKQMPGGCPAFVYPFNPSSCWM